MNRWTLYCTLTLMVGALVGCGGGDGSAVTPVRHISDMQPGEKFAMETPLLEAGSQVSHYVVYGVTPEGALVDSSQPGLLNGVRVPILESVQRNGGDSALQAKLGGKSSQFVDPATLRRKQVEFFQQLWTAMAGHEGTRDPRAILAEIDDLDMRVIDLMDDVSASGVTLAQYLTFYDLLDEMPAFADKPLAELNLREALSEQDNASIFEEEPLACTTGLTRQVSQSGLYSYCRVGTAQANVQSKTLMTASGVLSGSTEPNVAGILKLNPGPELETAIWETMLARQRLQDERIAKAVEAAKSRAARASALNAALRQNGSDSQLWRAYCSQNHDLDCTGSDASDFGVVMAIRAQAMIDENSNTSQLNLLELQNLMAQMNDAFETTSNLLKKFADTRTAIVSNMR